MKKKTAAEIRNDIYFALKNSKNKELTYKELLHFSDVANTNFAGAIQYISKFYPNIVKVKRGTYKLIDKDNESSFRYNLNQEMEKIIKNVEFNDFDDLDYKIFKKLVELKKELEESMNVHK